VRHQACRRRSAAGARQLLGDWRHGWQRLERLQRTVCHRHDASGRASRIPSCVRLRTASHRGACRSRKIQTDNKRTKVATLNGLDY
jgi:hypothetical protein